jgi:hypothetical protein
MVPTKGARHTHAELAFRIASCGAGRWIFCILFQSRPVRCFYGFAEFDQFAHATPTEFTPSLATLPLNSTGARPTGRARVAFRHVEQVPAVAAVADAACRIGELFRDIL